MCNILNKLTLLVGSCITLCAADCILTACLGRVCEYFMLPHSANMLLNASGATKYVNGVAQEVSSSVVSSQFTGRLG